MLDKVQILDMVQIWNGCRGKVEVSCQQHQSCTLSGSLAAASFRILMAWGKRLQFSLSVLTLWMSEHFTDCTSSKKPRNSLDGPGPVGPLSTSFTVISFFSVMKMKRFCLFRHEKQPVKIFLLWLKRIFLKKLHSAPLGLFSFEPKHTVGKHLYGINGMFLFLNWDYWVRTRRSQKGNTAFFSPSFLFLLFFYFKKKSHLLPLTKFWCDKRKFLQDEMLRDLFASSLHPKLSLLFHE